MTGYFIVALIISLLLVIALYAILKQRLQINWTRRNRRGMGYLLPAFIACLFVFVIIFDTFPRLLDTVNMAQNNLKKLTVSGEEIIVKNHYYIIDHQTYITGFRTESINPKLEYSISYLPNTRIVVKSEMVETLPAGKEPAAEALPPQD